MALCASGPEQKTQRLRGRQVSAGGEQSVEASANLRVLLRQVSVLGSPVVDHRLNLRPMPAQDDGEDNGILEAHVLVPPSLERSGQDPDDAGVSAGLKRVGDCQ